MRKIAAYLALGLIAGFAIAKLTGGGAGSDVPVDDRLERRVDRLEAALADERSARLRLEAAVGAGSAGGPAAENDAPGDAGDYGPDPGEAGRRFGDAAASGQGPGEVTPGTPFGPPGRRGQNFDLGERLVAAGFTPERSAYIVDRTEALRLQALEARYAAARDGDNEALRGLPNLQATLRSELGDTDYERYLTALGRPTSVEVSDVLANSPAAQAGFSAGDRIVGYGGTRVFDINELNRLTLDGDPGAPVAVDVIRDGQTIQLYLPRGPLGITGGRGFGRPR